MRLRFALSVFARKEFYAQTQSGPKPRFLSVADALSPGGITIESDTDGEIPLWMEALTPIRNFSKEPEDNVFCRITANSSSFDASTLRVYLLDPGIVLQKITLK